MMEFLFGLVLGAFITYIILRERIKISRRLLLSIVITVLVTLSVGVVVTSPVTVHKEAAIENTYEIPGLPNGWENTISEKHAPFDVPIFKMLNYWDFLED